MTRSLRLAIVPLFLAAVTAGSAEAGVPRALRTRLKQTDPVWRELPIRVPLQRRYDYCWQLAVNTVLENNYDIASMEKTSGYIRSSWNEGVVLLRGRWFYKVQISLKFVFDQEDYNPDNPRVTKVRLQVAGEVVKVTNKGVRQYYRGYDEVVLAELFQDLQSKFGSI